MSITLDTAFGAETEQSLDRNKIHLRIQQRNRRQSTTTASGFADDFDYKGFVKTARKKFCCGGSVVENHQGEMALQFNGDQRQGLVDLLISKGVAQRGDIIVHGY